MITKYNKLEFEKKKKREIGGNERSQLASTLGKKTKRIYLIHNTNNTLSVVSGARNEFESAALALFHR